MIGWLQGTLKQKHIGTQKIILAVGGVGYQIQLTAPVFDHLPDLESPMTLHVHQVVREDLQALYGFMDVEQCQLFESLIKSNGIGPRLALAILSQMTPATLLQCVADQDKVRLSQIKGIGPRMAARLLLDLKPLLQMSWSVSIDAAGHKASRYPADALAALTALGYTEWEAQKALNNLKLDNQDIGAWVRGALALLGPQS